MSQNAMKMHQEDETGYGLRQACLGLRNLLFLSTHQLELCRLFLHWHPSPHILRPCTAV